MFYVLGMAGKDSIWDQLKYMYLKIAPEMQRIHRWY